ncbi:hypothetical protein EDD22DRAFT_848220 [Suillus occidentalis]|nr:hypothetical protein EDD22DRAFT_848220 [Suillus occidentalis]
MKVVKPALLTCPDHIILGMYTEGSKVHPFKVIYCGPGGHHRHVHVHCLYTGTIHLDPKADDPHPSSSLNSGPKGSSHGKVPSRQKSKAKHQPYSIEAHPACPAQSGESRDKWQDPDTPYLPPLNLHWEAAMKIAIKDQSYSLSLLFLSAPNCLNVCKHLQTYLANWLASHALWVGHVDHNPLCIYPTPQLWRDFLGGVPSAQPQSHKADRKGLMATEKRKQVMWESQGNREWKDDPASHKQLLHGVFLGNTGLLMWSEPFPSEHYGLWDNTLKGCLPYVENFCQLLCDWDGMLPLLMTPLTSDNFTDTKSWEVKPPIIPHSLPMQS